MSATAMIDVVLPVYNGAATIEAALRSLQDQTVTDIRILVIDDESTDATAEIVARIAAADGRVVLVGVPHRGIVDALNAGVRLCTAAFVARHDADDLAAPDRFARQLAYFQDHADCVAVSGMVRQVDAQGRVLAAATQLPPLDRADPSFMPQIEPYLIHPFLMVRRAAMNQVGGYRYVFHSEDTDLYWRLAEIGRLHNLAAVLGDYRIHDGSITGSSVVNGRISAVSSQMSGLSVLRRRAGRPDIEFPYEDLGAFKAARSLTAMVAIAAARLDAAEADRLAVSASLKLVEAAGYRPYELEAEDCAFAYAAQRRSRVAMTPANREAWTRMISGTAARLIHKGRIRSALRLTPVGLYPAVLARLLVRVALPGWARTLLKRAAGRDVSFVK